MPPRSAIDAARRVDAKLIYGDLSGARTEAAIRSAGQGLASSPANLARLAGSLGTDPDVIKILGTMGGAAVGAAPKGDALDALIAGMLDRSTARRLGSVLDRHVPELATALLHDRDDHMADELRRAATQGTVVGVVGIAHMEGIERRFPTSTILQL